jgi:membrane protease YdiL (CAAX protease family)
LAGECFEEMRTSGIIRLRGGSLVAVATILATRLLVRRTLWARALHAEFRARLGPLRSTEIWVFATTSGVAEELFFRGAMQPALGLFLSSLVFGAVHVGPSRRFWTWTLWAGVMGLVLGALYEGSGTLLAPIVAHVVINYENLHFIRDYDPNRQASAAGNGGRGPALLPERHREGRGGDIPKPRS